MKKVLLAAGLIFCMAAPALAGGEVQVSGSVEIQYRHSTDLYPTKGNDDLRAEELYLQFEKEVADNVSALIKLDGSDMDNKTGGSSTHKNVEEAQVIFQDIAGSPATIILGKAEMPFGQDYEKFLLNSNTHEFEIDKVWGLQGSYKVDGFGSVAAAIFERAPGKKSYFVGYTSAGSTVTKVQLSEDYDPDTSMIDSFAVKLKADKLIENVSFEVSHARVGRDEAVAAEVNEHRTSVAAKFSAGALGLHAEYTTFSDLGNKKDSDLDVILVGADYKIGSWLLKARHEASDNDVDNDGSEEGRTAAGLSYYFSDKAFVALEWERVSFDGSGKDDTDEFLAGAAFKF